MKKSTKRKRVAPKPVPKKRPKDHVTVSKGSGYGPALYGTKVYFEGSKPTWLAPNGKFNLGKHILETLRQKFGDEFRLIISKSENSIEVKWNVRRVKVSRELIARMGKEYLERTRDIKLDIVAHHFGKAFPDVFTEGGTKPYVAGNVARVLDGVAVAKLSSEDKEAINKILPDFVASESIKSVSLLSAKAHIKTLRELEAELRDAIKANHSESWWQTYIKDRILLIQHGYIQAVDKLNVAVGITKFPDFILVTHDSFVDILEIKKPNTPLLKHDESRDNYYWDPEMARAVIQTENYVAVVEKNSDALRSHLKDKHKLDLQVLRPRGIILAGNAEGMEPQKQKDDLRLLSHGLKHVTVVTYDELLTRLSNYIAVLEKYLPEGSEELKPVETKTA